MLIGLLTPAKHGSLFAVRAPYFALLRATEAAYYGFLRVAAIALSASELRLYGRVLAGLLAETRAFASAQNVTGLARYRGCTSRGSFACARSAARSGRHSPVAPIPGPSLAGKGDKATAQPHCESVTPFPSFLKPRSFHSRKIRSLRSLPLTIPLPPLAFTRMYGAKAYAQGHPERSCPPSGHALRVYGSPTWLCLTCISCRLQRSPCREPLKPGGPPKNHAGPTLAALPY